MSTPTHARYTTTAPLRRPGSAPVRRARRTHGPASPGSARPASPGSARPARRARGVAVVALVGLLTAAAPALLSAQQIGGGARSGETSTSTLTVEQAQRLAESAAGDLERAKIRVEQARAEIDIARSRRRPQISGRLSGSYLVFPPEGESIPRGALGTAPDPGGLPTPIPETDIEIIPDRESTFYSLSSSIEQVLFTWGKVSEGISAAESERAAAEAEVIGERVDVAKNVREAYFSAALARDTVEQLREAEEIMAQVVADREEGFDAGVRTREEVLEMKAEAASIRRQRVSAEQGMRSALRALSILTGVDAEEKELISDYREGAQTEAEASLLDEALAFSPEVRTLRNRAQAAQSALHVAERTDRLQYPDIALVVDMEVSGQQLPLRTNWQDRWDTDITVTIATRFTVYDGGAQAARIRQARGDLRSARLGISDARDGVELEVRSAREAVVGAEAEFVDAEARLEYVSEQRRNAQVSYENDVISREELLLARLQERVARIERDAAAFSLETALTELEALTGDILR